MVGFMRGRVLGPANSAVAITELAVPVGSAVAIETHTGQIYSYASTPGNPYRDYSGHQLANACGHFITQLSTRRRRSGNNWWGTLPISR